MSPYVVNSLCYEIHKSEGPVAIVFTGERLETITGRTMKVQLERRLRFGVELVGVYQRGCGIRTVMDDVGSIKKKGRRNGR